MPAVGILFLALIVGLLAVAAYYSHKKARQRMEGLRLWAERNGLQFQEVRDGGYEEMFPSHGCLCKGSNRYAYNRCEGIRNGNPIHAFDYHYETYTTDSKGRTQVHHHHFSAVVVKSPLLLKPLFIRPEHLFDKVCEFFGADDIDFESSEFSKRFYVKAADKRWAYDVIHQRTMEFLLASPQFAIEFGTWDAIVYRSSLFSGAEEFEAALGVVEGIFERFPEYLRKQQRGE